MGLKVTPTILSIENLSTYKRSQAFNQVLASCEVIALKYKAKRMFVDELKRNGFHFYSSENSFTITSIENRDIDLRFYHYGHLANDCQSILAILKNHSKQFEFSNEGPSYPSLYKTQQEIESYFNYEMTAKEFNQRKQILVSELTALINEVKELKTNG